MANITSLGDLTVLIRGVSQWFLGRFQVFFRRLFRKVRDSILSGHDSIFYQENWSRCNISNFSVVSRDSDIATRVVVRATFYGVPGSRYLTNVVNCNIIKYSLDSIVYAIWPPRVKAPIVNFR